jgi:hypothetical protein
MTMNPFHPTSGGTVSLSATSTTGAVALALVPGGQFQIRYYNKGPNTVFVKRGTSTVTAALTDYPLPSGIVEVVTVNNPDAGGVTHIAGICAATETATLYISIGSGF